MNKIYLMFLPAIIRSIKKEMLKFNLALDCTLSIIMLSSDSGRVFKGKCMLIETV